MRIDPKGTIVGYPALLVRRALRQLSVLVPPQPVGTKQPRKRIVHRTYRAFVFYRCPDQTINVF
jgi:hypothetical protein